jgi:hypothetical protein
MPLPGLSEFISVKVLLILKLELNKDYAYYYLFLVKGYSFLLFKSGALDSGIFFMVALMGMKWLAARWDSLSLEVKVASLFIGETLVCLMGEIPRCCFTELAYSLVETVMVYDDLQLLCWSELLLSSSFAGLSLPGKAESTGQGDESRWKLVFLTVV